MRINQSIIFLTHIVNNNVIERFNELFASTHDKYDVFFAIHNEKCEDVSLNNIDNLYSFRLEDLKSLHYSPHGSTLYHNTNYVVQKFRKDKPYYDYYWFVEYDVVFTGEWSDFFNHYSETDYDFISSHIEFHNETNNQWCWWSRTNWKGINLPRHQLLKSFNPICRYSAKALDFLDAFLRKGINGHFEAILATALYNYGYRLLDIGGTGDFSEKGKPDLFYIQEEGVNNGSIRWRPIFTSEDIDALKLENILFHPVKTRTE